MNTTVQRAFERAGAKVITKVFKNLDAEDIRDSVAEFEEAIAQAQIIMFPGGFSAGDEPDGSAKFFATAFQNAKIKEAVEKLLNEQRRTGTWYLQRLPGADQAGTGSVWQDHRTDRRILRH